LSKRPESWRPVRAPVIASRAGLPGRVWSVDCSKVGQRKKIVEYSPKVAREWA